MLEWECIGSGKTGLYSNYYRHRIKCIYCTPELEEERQAQERQNQLVIQREFQVLDAGN
jgi:hypothetical protein